MSEKIGYLNELFVSYQGEGPWIGKRQLFIRLAGCSRRCDYCDTRSSWLAHPEKWRLFGNGKRSIFLSNPVSVLTLVHWVKEMMHKQGPFSSIALTGGEPLQQKGFLVESASELKKNIKNADILLETNGLEPILDKKLIRSIDFFSIDFKLKSSSKQKPDLKLAIQNLTNLERKKGCIKVVVNAKTQSRELVELVRALHRLQPGWELILQPQSGNKGVLERTLKRCDAIAKTVMPIHSAIRILPQMHRYLKIK